MFDNYSPYSENCIFHPPTHRVASDVCVVPIEDIETDHVSPELPPTTLSSSNRRHSSSSKRAGKLVEMDTLPGTPSTEHTAVSLESGSHCGSSVSSEVSVKSSDMLLPGNK